MPVEPLTDIRVFVRRLLRAAAARTMPDLWQKIADAIKRFTPIECHNYLIAAGYDAT